MARTKTNIANVLYDDVRKSFYVSMDYGKDPFTNKRVIKTKTTKTKAEAKKVLKEFEAAKTREELVIPHKDTLSEWLEYWLENIVAVQCERTTYEGYRAIIRHIIPSLGGLKLQSLRPNDLQMYYKNKLNELSANTVNKHHTLLKTALKIAVEQDKIYRNPVDKVKPPKKVKIETAFCTKEDVIKIFEAVSGTNIETPICLAAYLGLRREELCALTWEDVDFDKKTIKIQKARVVTTIGVIEKVTKNISSNRTLALPLALEEILKKTKLKQKENKLFFGDCNGTYKYLVSNDLGEPIMPNSLSGMIHKFMIRRKLSHFNLRALRHTVATLGNDAGLTMFDISRMLGHSSPDTTSKIYTHLFDKTQKKGVDIVALALSK